MPKATRQREDQSSPSTDGVYVITFYGPVPAHKNEKMPRLKRNEKKDSLYVDPFSGKIDVRKAYTPTLITKPQVKQEMNSLALQIPGWMRDLKLEHPKVEVWFYTPRDTFDRSNGWAAIEDLLWRYGVIVDDNIRHFNGVIILYPAIISEDWKTEVRLYPKQCPDTDKT